MLLPFRRFLPSEADLRSPDVGKWIEKYYQGSEGVPVEDRMRVLRLIENLTLGSAAVGYLTESMHGAGSPQAQRIMISRLVDLKGKQRKAKRLCGIIRESGGSIIGTNPMQQVKSIK
jgi:4-hydroxybutyryl-CoA dehydratase/vinylacetyl-CoA-Delta-isomerase